jgi:DNA-binding MarR family transcriptional regulator
MTRTAAPAVDTLTHDLWSALSPLIRRVFASYSMPYTQMSALSRLDRCGPATSSELAAQQHVRPQSMAATVGELESAGLVNRTADPGDGRKMLVTITARGRETLARERANSQRWLRDALSGRLSPAEQADLARVVSLLERLTAE